MTNYFQTKFSKRQIYSGLASRAPLKAQLQRDKRELEEYMSEQRDKAVRARDDFHNVLNSTISPSRETTYQGLTSSEGNDTISHAADVLENSYQILQIYENCEKFMPAAYPEETAKQKQNWQDKKEDFKRLMESGRRLTKREVRKRLGMALTEEPVADPIARAIFNWEDKPQFRDGLKYVQKGIKKMSKMLPP